MATIDYYNSLINRVNDAANCDDLSNLNAEITSIFDEALANIQESISALEPLMVKPSADLGAILTWIDSVIFTFTVPHANLLALQTETLAKQQEAMSALSLKFAELECDL